MGDNYLVINGQRIEFTEEQKKQQRIGIGGKWKNLKN